MAIPRKTWPPRLKPSVLALLAFALLAILAAAVISLNQPQPVALTDPQAQEIAAVLQKAERLFGEVGCNRSVNVNVLDAVLTDSPFLHQPAGNARAMVMQVYGQNAVGSAGFLTERKAFYLTLRGDYPTAHATPSNGLNPTPRPIFYCPTPTPEHLLSIQSVAIGPDRAVARYDNGPALIEATLIHDEGLWKIADFKYIIIHF